MSSHASTPTIQVCRSCGGGAPLDVHFCPQCSKILSIGRLGDYFSFLGLPRKLTIDADVLEQRFRALSRQVHPDYFYGAAAAERRASLERSSYLNDAHRTLRQPETRVEYLLELEGYAPKGPTQASKAVSASLLEEVFAFNEELDAVRQLRASGASDSAWRDRIESVRRLIEAKRTAHDAELDRLALRWDRLVDEEAPAPARREVLEALCQRVLERTYITNLLAAIEKELND